MLIFILLVLENKKVVLGFVLFVFVYTMIYITCIYAIISNLIEFFYLLTALSCYVKDVLVLFVLTRENIAHFKHFNVC